MNTLLLAKYLGGSHLYGLSTPKSDIDDREIFLNTEPAYILGTKRFDQEVRNNENEDVHKVELRRFLELMRKGNTQSVEVLYAKEESFIFLHPIIKELRANKGNLIDSTKLFKVVSSFIHAQSFLMFDDKRKAEKGGKRAGEIEKYGFNPKAAVTSLRLSLSGISYFQGNGYQVEMDNPLLMELKLHPENFSVETVRCLVSEWDSALKVAFDNTSVNDYFNEKYADKVLLDSYLPFLV